MDFQSPSLPRPRPLVAERHDHQGLLLEAIRGRESGKALGLAQTMVHRRGLAELETFRLGILPSRLGPEAAGWFDQLLTPAGTASLQPMAQTDPEPSPAPALLDGSSAPTAPAAELLESRVLSEVDAAIAAVMASFPPETGATSGWGSERPEARSGDARGDGMSATAVNGATAENSATADNRVADAGVGPDIGGLAPEIVKPLAGIGERLAEVGEPTAQIRERPNAMFTGIPALEISDPRLQPQLSSTEPPVAAVISPLQVPQEIPPVFVSTLALEPPLAPPEPASFSGLSTVSGGPEVRTDGDGSRSSAATGAMAVARRGVERLRQHWPRAAALMRSALGMTTGDPSDDSDAKVAWEADWQPSPTPPGPDSSPALTTGTGAGTSPGTSRASEPATAAAAAIEATLPPLAGGTATNTAARPLPEQPLRRGLSNPVASTRQAAPAPRPRALAELEGWLPDCDLPKAS